MTTWPEAVQTIGIVWALAAVAWALAWWHKR